MENQTVYVVVTSNDKDNQIISHSTFKTVHEAQDCVYHWYDNYKITLNDRNVEWKGECFEEPFGAYAWIEHEGIKEFCQSLVVTLP